MFRAGNPERLARQKQRHGRERYRRVADSPHCGEFETRDLIVDRQSIKRHVAAHLGGTQHAPH